jgi:hypothetical protein
MQLKSFSFRQNYAATVQRGNDGAGSVSRLALDLEVIGKGSAKCELVRHLAPTTSRSILTSLPIQGRAHKFGDSFVYFETGIVIGSEKQKTSFKRGDMGLLVANGSICIFLKDATVQAMNPLGRVVEGLKLVESTGPGDVMLLKKPTA